MGLKRPEVGSTIQVRRGDKLVTETITSARVESLHDQVIWLCEIAPKPKAPRAVSLKPKGAPRPRPHCTDCGSNPWDGSVCSWTGMRHGGRT